MHGNKRGKTQQTSIMQVICVSRFFLFSLSSGCCLPPPSHSSHSSTVGFILYDFRSLSLHFSRFLILSLLNVCCCTGCELTRRVYILVESFKIIKSFLERARETERRILHGCLLLFFFIHFTFCSNCHLFVCCFCVECTSVFMCMSECVCAYIHLVILNLLSSNRAHSTDTPSHHYAYRSIPLGWSVGLYIAEEFSSLWAFSYLCYLSLRQVNCLETTYYLQHACIKCRIRVLALLCDWEKAFDHTHNTL